MRSERLRSSVQVALNINGKDSCEACADIGWVNLAGSVTAAGATCEHGCTACRWCEQGVASTKTIRRSGRSTRPATSSGMVAAPASATTRRTMKPSPLRMGGGRYDAAAGRGVHPSELRAARPPAPSRRRRSCGERKGHGRPIGSRATSSRYVASPCTKLATSNAHRPFPGEHRALWALAFYAGLRLGELRGVRWRDVDLDAGELHVEQSYCNVSRRMVAPKSAAGRRVVPIAGALRGILLEHRLLARRLDPELVVASRRGTHGTLEHHDRDRPLRPPVAWRAEPRCGEARRAAPWPSQVRASAKSALWRGGPPDARPAAVS